MGADIHGVYQTRFKLHDGKMSTWRTGGEVEDARNYWLFGALAGVRRHFEVKPIAEGRGLPEDFDMVDESTPLYWARGGEVWMGDHSHTWMTTKEILEWDGWDFEPEPGESLRDACQTFLAFIRYIDLKDDEVRIVIGFDN